MGLAIIKPHNSMLQIHSNFHQHTKTVNCKTLPTLFAGSIPPHTFQFND